jgi:WXG100 family type VII secretion target
MGMPAEDHTFVRFGSMDEAFEDLKAVVTELDRVTDQLYADIKKELGPSWEGEAQTYFDQKKNEWNALEVQMGQELFNAASAVNVANGNYQSAERRNIGIWSD